MQLYYLLPLSGAPTQKYNVVDIVDIHYIKCSNAVDLGMKKLISYSASSTGKGENKMPKEENN